MEKHEISIHSSRRPVNRAEKPIERDLHCIAIWQVGFKLGAKLLFQYFRAYGFVRVNMEQIQLNKSKNIQVMTGERKVSFYFDT